MSTAGLSGRVDDLHATLVVAVGMSPENAWGTTAESALRYAKKVEQLHATQALLLSGLLLSPFAGKGKAAEMGRVVEEALRPVGKAPSIRERFGERFAEEYERRIEDAKRYVEKRLHGGKDDGKTGGQG